MILEKSNKPKEQSKNKIEELEAKVNEAKGIEDVAQQAMFYRNGVFEAMNELRAVGDEMEISTAANFWPYPTYGDLLYGVR